ncbi:tetratricopeptide repeat protein [Stella sp.]|uniref:tetratricopeptide repeat protein n=1 Tax=Stella sp. TaxID=2912054 RepID=UPI0035AF00D1
MTIQPQAWEQALAAAAEAHAAGRLAEAEERLRGILRDLSQRQRVRPVPVLLRLAGVLVDRGEAERAYAIADEAAALDPRNPLALNLRGSTLGLLGRWTEAEAAFRAAVAADPGMVEGHFNLGRLLAGQGRNAEATLAFRTALDLAPEASPIRRALSGTLRDEGRFAAALAELDRVMAAEPAGAELCNERAILLMMSGRTEEAVAEFDRALVLQPDFVAPRFNRSLALLRLGDFRRGWAEYEHRFRTEMVRPLPFAQPRWQGEPIAGRAIVLWGEQGHGDTLQFARYAPLVADRGAEVVVVAQAGLVRLLHSLRGVRRVVAPGQPVGPHDLHAPLMSLPALFGTTPETVPAEVPYLAPDAGTRARWAGRLPDRGRLRVGLVWAGDARPHLPMSNATDRRRSVRLEALAPLFAVDGVDFVSLQFGGRAGDRTRVAFGPQMADPMGEVRDFADTAAIVEQLDLVVTVDTAIAHLAGALARPVWVLSRFDGCFRWMSGRDDSPWYPTMRLFRQEAPGDWTPVIARVAAALREAVRTPANADA